MAGPGRHRARGWPAPPHRPTGGRRRGCWTSPCPGPPWPACPRRRGCWAASAPSPLPRPASSPPPPRTDPAAQWRIIITSPAGQAITVTRIPRRTRDGPGPGRGRPPPGAGLAGRITLTITQDTIRDHTTRGASPAASAAGPGPPAQAGRPGPASGPRPPAGAARPGRQAPRYQPGPPDPARSPGSPPRRCAPPPAPWIRRWPGPAADDAAGGCAHHAQSDAYRPPPRLREHVTARDVTCRNPACRQPAWRADLDHTRPWENGGPTCGCNLGGACRRHHKLKQHPRWKLEQARPGHFTWTTPAGRERLPTTPDTHPL